MNDFALASNRTVTVGDITVRQCVMSEFDRFVEYAHPVREALRADKSDAIKTFLANSNETVGLVQLLTNAKDLEHLSSEPELMINIIMALHTLNTAFFEEEKKPERRKTNDKSTWFDGFQFLISNGHQHNQIMQYTYGTYLGYIKAAARAQRQNMLTHAIATRNAQHATKQGFESFERELKKD